MKKSNQNNNQENIATVPPASSDPLDVIRTINESGNNTLKAGMEDYKGIVETGIGAYKEMYTNGANPELDKMAIEGVNQVLHEASERMAEQQNLIAKMESSALQLIHYSLGLVLLWGIGTGKIKLEPLKKAFAPILSLQ